MTKTQAELLAALRAIKAEGAAKIPAANSRAIGGLCEVEKRQFVGVRVDGHFVGNVQTKSFLVRGASIRTFEALARVGAVDCKHGIWAAV